MTVRPQRVVWSRAAAILAGGLLVPAGLAADEVAGAGQPFCRDPGELRQYLVASATRDERWKRSLAGCVEAAAGQRFSILEAGEEDEGASVPRVRLSVPGRGFVEGYTLMRKAP